MGANIIFTSMLRIALQWAKYPPWFYWQECSPRKQKNSVPPLEPHHDDWDFFGFQHCIEIHFGVQVTFGLIPQMLLQVLAKFDTNAINFNCFKLLKIYNITCVTTTCWKWDESALDNLKMLRYLCCTSFKSSIWDSSSISTVLEDFPSFSEISCLVHLKVEIL